MLKIIQTVAYTIARTCHDEKTGRLIAIPLEAEPVFPTEQAAERRAQEIIREAVDAEKDIARQAAKEKRRNKANADQKRKLRQSMAFAKGDK